MRNYFISLFVFSAFVACDSIDSLSFESSLLQINAIEAEDIKVEIETSTRATVLTSSFTDGESFGISLQNAASDENDYSSYKNKEYKYQSDGKLTGDPIMLSGNKGNLYAYYPYDANVSDVASIPVTADCTDYLFAQSISNIDNSKSTVAKLSMKHALSVVEVIVKKGTYSGTGKITSLKIGSEAISSSGSLDAKTGKVTASGGNIIIADNVNGTITSEQNYVKDILVVPAGCETYGSASNSATFSLMIIVDGKAYSATTNAVAIKQGQKALFTVSLTDTGLVIEAVTILSWGTYTSATSIKIPYEKSVTVSGIEQNMVIGNIVSTSSSLSFDVYSILNNYHEEIKDPTISAGTYSSYSCENIYNYYQNPIGKHISVSPTKPTTITFNGYNGNMRNGHEVVDLGTTQLWAKTNLGAASATDYGDYFAWGETWTHYNSKPSGNSIASNLKTPFTGYNEDSYAFYDASKTDKITKYVKNATLEGCDDAATAMWGGAWHIPTIDDFQQLANRCFIEWTDNYNGSNVEGIIVYSCKSNATGKTYLKYNNSWYKLAAGSYTNYVVVSQPESFQSYSLSTDHIFLPAAGLYNGAGLFYQNFQCRYWANRASTATNLCSFILCYSFGTSTLFELNPNATCSRWYGVPIRPVWSSQ